MLRRRLKPAFLRASKWLGLFRLSRHITRRELRILCYHGISMRDEDAFRPQVFIDPSQFEQHLRSIARRRFPVLPLQEAVERLARGTLPDNAVAITIDDGFYSTYKHAVPMLQELGLPATVYVTSYYSEKKNPIFRLAVQYIAWAARSKRFRLENLGIEELRGETQIAWDDPDDPLMWKIIEHGETGCDEPGRLALAQRLAALLGIDFDALVQGRFLSIMTAEEIRSAAAAGIDIQLHTHRHRFPIDEASVKQEISDNRAALEPLVGHKLHHFCYPSGYWSKRQLPWLEQLDVKTATTCEIGLNKSGAHPLALKRLFDSSEISALELEAELMGFLDLIRRARAGMGALRQRIFGPKSTATGQTQPQPH